MGLVQIEESELANLRSERDRERDAASVAKQAQADAERERDEAQVAKQTAEDEKKAAETKATQMEEKANKASLRDTRMGALGDKFLAKLGDVKARLTEQAAEMEDTAWDERVKELVALTGVESNAKSDDKDKDKKKDDEADKSEQADFSMEELAKLVPGGDKPEGMRAPTGDQRRSVVSGLASTFSGNGKKD